MTRSPRRLLAAVALLSALGSPAPGAGGRVPAGGPCRPHRQQPGRWDAARGDVRGPRPRPLSRPSPGLPQPRVLRRRGRRPPPLRRLRLARRVADPGRGRRDPGLLRLQRVVRRRRGAPRVQGQARRDGASTPSPRRTTASRPPGWSWSRRSRPRRPSTGRTSPIPRPSTIACKLYTGGDLRGGQGPRHPLRRPLRPLPRALREGGGLARTRVAHDEWGPPQGERRPQAPGPCPLRRDVSGRPRARRRPGSKAVREPVRRKNIHWFHRYRTVDGYSIFGGRADLSFTDGQTNRVVAAREMEGPRRDDRQPRRGGIWASAEGRSVTPDDYETPPVDPGEDQQARRGSGRRTRLPRRRGGHRPDDRRGRG